MAKAKVKAEKQVECTVVTVDHVTPKAPDNKSLFDTIDHLSGPEKQKFCATLTAEQKKAYYNYVKEKDLTLVTGVFKCLEPVGGSVMFSCTPYPGTSYSYTMLHGEEYTVPFCVAKHLEMGCWYPTHAHILNDQGLPIPGIGKKNYRFSFNTGDMRAINQTRILQL